MISYHKIFLAFLSLLIQNAYSTPETADFVILSYDRPIQLYALLESTAYYLKGINQITVLYRTSNPQFETAYQEVQKKFNTVHFIAQGINPHADFKPLFLRACTTGPSPYILFAPDDIIVKNHANITECIQALEEYGAFAFFLRLGTHINYCYSEQQDSPVPLLTKLSSTIYAWKFRNQRGDWGYPHNVDMTIYRKQDILNDLTELAYTTPNSLEGAWAQRAGKIMDRKGLCFCQSVIVNIPVNLVQHEERLNPHMNSWSTDQLLELFQEGKKIDIKDLEGICNKSCHTEYELKFIIR